MGKASQHTELMTPARMLEQLNDAIVILHADGQVLFANQAAHTLLDEEDLTGQPIELFLEPGTVMQKEREPILLELNSADQMLVQIRNWKLNDGYICLFIHPVRFKDQKENQMYALKYRMNQSHEGMVLHQAGQIIDCDDSLAKIFGYNKSELIRASIDEFIDSSYFHTLKENMKKDHDKPYLLKGYKKSGEPLYIDVLPQPYPDKDGDLRIAVIRDVTERVQSEKQIQFMAYYDELTDLPNRNYFVKTLEEAIAECRKDNGQIAVHFVDIDYFKQINDTLGYQFGDALLRACSHRLKQLLDGNNFIARMSGDEFLILQRDIQNKEEAEAFAEKVIQAFQTPIDVQDFEIFTTVSIGISIFPENGNHPNELIKQADSAMYVIKENQRNHYKIFESSITEDFKEMLTIENELRRAIKQKQFEVHYQPQVDISNNQVIGFEALLRWKHPSRGYISPGMFIPLAEKTGLIIEIGDWVLREACRQNRKWHQKGYGPTKVSVNLSVKQFLQKDLVKKVRDILQESKLDAKYLELEITESMAMSNEAYIMDTLKGLKELGVNVSIDDFGTGYSSMKYLSQFPLSKLKIDQLFIRGEQKQNQAIVKSIIHLSHSLDMKVIAEGVETREQLEFLKGEKCDEIQGFYFSKPVAPGKAERFFSYH
ncbi:EAL domain-containing protein [Virgibacillus sp. MSP4-1]|uniref:sensor domain-containing protein n=1 Tax=Virgibacillus sp. MSP4-1 TaxID=2700081 RepID=UPI00039A4412|nr:EAL domain-containing protein [Virgibacillus sp. MSP4-1]QHS22070.1 EAL domain-containing protein [Virgibacillus sp. MSP4-1]